VQHTPLVGQPELVAGGDAFGPVDLPHQGEQRVRAEVLDPVVVVARCCGHRTTQALATDSPEAQNPYSTRVLRVVT